MTKQTWIIAGILSTLAVIFFISVAAWQTAHELDKARLELARLQAQAQAAQAESEDRQRQAAQAQEELTALREDYEQLQKENEAVTRVQQSLEDEMRKAIESKEVTISELQGRLTVNILDRILFESGEAMLREEGEKVLSQIAGVLAQHPQRQLQVIGHTDNVPIRVSARGRFPSNWELSTARATAAVRFLQDRAGVDPRRMGAVGCGEFRPIADNATPEGRARNRRIEVVILPEDLPVKQPPPPATPAGAASAPGDPFAAHPSETAPRPKAAPPEIP